MQQEGHEPSLGKGAPGGPPTRPLVDPVGFAAHIRARVLEETRLHCSVGIGDNKLRAKIATEFGKPRGSYVLTEENWFEVMGDRPTTALWGIGGKTAKKLAALGIDTVTQLARSDARVLAAELGPTMGPWYHRLGRGVSDSVVTAEPWVPRAHGRETTFQEDLEDWDRIAEEVRDADPAGRRATSTRRAGRRRGWGSSCATSRSSRSAAASPSPSRPTTPSTLADAGGEPAGPGRARPAGPAARRPARDGAARGRLLDGSAAVSPDSIAKTTSWARSRACSFTMARETWVRTVSGLTTSTSAISWLDRPVATHATTSRSRSVSWSSWG